METDKDEIAWYEAGEEYFVEQPAPLIGEKLGGISIVKLAAFLVGATGVSTRSEIYATIVAHLIYTFGFGQKNIDGIYGFLAGVHLAKKQYRYASIPLLVDSYESINQYRKLKTFKSDTIGKNVLLLLGFGSAYLKII